MQASYPGPGVTAGPRATPLSRVPSVPFKGSLLGLILGLTAGLWVAVGAIGELLTTMHPPGVAGRDLAQGFSTTGLGGGADAGRASIDTWRAFDALDVASGFASAFTVARAWLVLDLVLIVLYTVAILAIARPFGPLSTGAAPGTLATVRLLVLVVAATDAIENTLALIAVNTRSDSRALYSVLFGVRSFKLFVLVVPLVALLVLLLLRKGRIMLAERRIRQGVVMARAQILVVLLLGLIIWYQPTSDVFLDIGVSQTLSIVVFGGLLILGVSLGARVLIDRDRVRHPPAFRLAESVLGRMRAVRGRETLGALIGAMLAGALVAAGLLTGWRGLYGAALVFVIVVTTSWLLRDSETPAPEKISDRATARLPIILALAPPSLIGLALIHWTLWADVALGEPPVKAAVGLLVVGTAAALMPPIGTAVEAALDGWPTGPLSVFGRIAACGGRYGPGEWAIISTVLVAPLVLLFASTNLVDVRHIGAMGLALGAAGVLNLIGTSLVVIGDWWRDEFGLPSLFKMLRMRRIPVFLLMVLWLLVNTFAFAEPSYYDIETIGTNERITLEAAYESWADTYVEPDAVVPIVVVAAEGGGLRSAYWTERVLSELFPNSHMEPFALSGTSGGSVGIATYLARHHPPPGADDGGIGLADVEQPDFLSAVFHRWFTFDLAHSLLRRPNPLGDRAAALADALVEEIPALGLPHAYDPQGGFRPVTVFNAADLQDGCLIPITTLADLAGPAVTEDDHGCLDPDRSSAGAAYHGAADPTYDCPDRGMSIATAAVASARSPYVSPAGRLENCGRGVFYLADGGYVDNSGAVAAAVILERLEPLIAADNARGETCIVPIMLQIDNGAESLLPGGQAAGNPSQLSIVLSGALAANSARHDLAKIAAAEIVRRPLVDANGASIDVTYVPEPGAARAPLDPYERIFPLAQAGRDATVGWLLSEPSKDALDAQLEVAIAQARHLFSTGSVMQCAKGAPSTGDADS